MSAILCWTSAYGNHFSRPRFFSLLMAETAAGRGITSPWSWCHREGLSKGWNQSSVGWLLGKSAWPRPPGRGGRPPGSAGPLLPSPRRARSCCVSSCYSQEERGPSGRNQQNFRKLRVEKATSGYLGVWLRACNSSRQPAVPTEVALRAHFVK